ncbi:MAG: hypothetical protein ACR2L2_01110 [Acidobacteriota bacterium]
MALVRRAADWTVLKLVGRVTKSVPVIGTVVAVALAGYAVRRKGWRGGLAETALNAIPVVGAIKNGVEVFRGDFIPDRPKPGRTPGGPIHIE